MTTPADLCQAISAYYTQEVGLQDWFKQDVIGGLLNHEERLASQLIAIFTYQGFNPLEVMKRMKAAAMQYSRGNATKEELVVRYSTSTGAEEFKYDNQQSFTKDMTVLLTLFAQRGSTWEKIIGKSLNGVGDILEMLKEKYGIDTDVHEAGKSLPPDMVTIPRIAGCLPTLLLGLYHKGQAKNLVAMSKLGLPETTSKAVGCIYFVSAVPSSWITLGANQHLLFFLVHVLVDDIINRKKDNVTGLKDMLKYYQAAYFTPAVPDEKRAHFMISIGLGNAASTGFCDSINTAARLSEDMILQTRSEDADRMAVIAALKNLKRMNVPVTD